MTTDLIARQAVESYLKKKRKKLSSAEIATLAKVFLEGGRNALAAQLGSATEAAQAVDYAKSLSAIARKRLAVQTPRPIKNKLQTPDWKRIAGIITENKEHLAKLPGVVGLGPGYRIRAGIQQTERVVILFVEKKMPLIELGDTLPFPTSLQSNNGTLVGVDIVEFGVLQRSLSGGFGLGHSNQLGTLGVFGYRGSPSRTVAFTAMHVLNGSNPATTVLSCPWPSAAATAPLGKVVAGTMHETDAAAIQLINPQLASNTINSLGQVQGWRPITDSDRGRAVYMYGARSQRQVGIIEHIRVDLTRDDLLDVILVRIRAAKGDSGAAIVDNQNLVLGLLVGETSPESGVHVFTPINLVLAKLRCAIP